MKRFIRTLKHLLPAMALLTAGTASAQQPIDVIQSKFIFKRTARYHDPEKAGAVCIFHNAVCSFRFTALSSDFHALIFIKLVCVAALVRPLSQYSFSTLICHIKKFKISRQEIQILTAVQRSQLDSIPRLIG